MTTEWYRFFWNIYGFTGTGVVPVSKGGTGLNTIGNHQLIIGNANNVFEPALLSSASIAITYPAGFINLELGTSGVTPGTYGSASQVGVFTVNAYGVLTAASNTSIGIDASQIISGTLPVIRGGTGQSTYADGQLLIGNSTGNTLTKATLTAGTGISVTNGGGSITIANTGVLSVSGTAPVVSSGGATPAISMAAANTTTNGYLTSTDWNTFNNKAPATSGTSILYGNGSGGFSNVTIGTGVSFVGGTLSATGSGGTVTSVTGTSPVVSSGGTTPAISLATAYGDTLNPYASKAANYFLAAPNGSAGVPTFRAMVAADVPALAYVTSVSGTGSVNGITLTGTVTSSGSLTLGGTLGGIGNSQLTNSTISGVALGGNLFNLTAGTGVSFSAGTTYNGSAAITINATGTGGTVTSVAQSFTGGLISVAGSPITTSGTLALTVAGTSGGIPYFSSGTTWASSAALTQYGVVYGGGAGATPVATAAGTTGQVLTATTGGAPTWSSTYAGTVTSVAALTLGTTGTDLSSTVANGTTTPVITLQVPTASATNRGALSSADWTTFNNKAPAVTYTTNYIPYGQGTTTPNQSAGLQFDGTNFTTTGYATATSFRPSSATVPTNGLYLPATNSVGFATNTTNRMTIDASGFLGLSVTPSAWATGSNVIQTSNYGSVLSYTDKSIHISSNLYLNAGATSWVYLASDYATNYFQYQGAHIWRNAPSGTAGANITLTERMRLTAAGYLGIGTSSATAPIEVVGNGVTASIKSANDGGSTLLAFKNTSGTSLWDIGIGIVIRQDELAFRRQGTTVMYMSNTGGVSIGSATDAGTSGLRVAGLIYPQQATTAAAPAYVKGAIYFDTTLNKLRVGGATAWETITSV
jgi:hypothetical protein